MEVNFLKQQGNDELLPDNKQYREAIGKLLYISTLTHPDIVAAVGMLRRKIELPSKRDWNAVNRLAKYLNGTMHLKLKLPTSDKLRLVGYMDADWAGDTKNRKSTSGHLFFYDNGAVSWSSRKQETLALSSTEAEYISAAEACRQLK
ncbi:uncharacterized protein LOC129326226 [Eublepharis macularius]|uniref:Uncharacterized protein LOC129326226 n=1 Tax=Eublepharis macularius TaxID=481883 RepID=A0AA97J2Y8_EUBMA|nr:uncharacterized protein LOC129326226 [Eublepharis macularius]